MKATAIPRRVRLRGRKRTFTPRPYRFRFSKEIEKAAAKLLGLADAIFETCGGLDTAMRDLSHDGLARIVYIAFDTQSQNVNWEGRGERRYDDQQEWIEKSTAEWFRKREFAEWYCLGAGHCFDRVPPRTRADIMSRIFRVPGKKKKVAA
jgi:hypothetical protein